MADSIELVVRNTDRTFPVTPGQVVIAGRTAQCDLHLDDPSVSRRHCSITFENGTLRIQDLQSANGTYVNELSVSDAIVQPGDVIRLGAAVLDVRDPSGMPHPPEDTFLE